jgi:hypothetical protein
MVENINIQVTVLKHKMNQHDSTQKKREINLSVPVFKNLVSATSKNDKILRNAHSKGHL